MSNLLYFNEENAIYTPVMKYVINEVYDMKFLRELCAGIDHSIN